MSKELVEGCLHCGDRHLATAPGLASSPPTTSTLLLSSTAPQQAGGTDSLHARSLLVSAECPIRRRPRPSMRTTDPIDCFPIDEVQLHAAMGGRRRPTGPSFGRVVRCAIPSDGPANRPRVAARAMPSPFEPAITITEARGPWSVTRISVISDQLLVTSRRFRNVRIELPVVWIGPSWPTFGRDATRVVQSSSTRQIRSVWQVVGVSGALGVVKAIPTTSISNRTRTTAESGVRWSAEARRFG